MSPTETTTILRQFNEWRRGDEDIPQFDPNKIGAAIDAAIGMIERLDRLIHQEPIGWLFDGDFYEVRQMSLYKDNEPLQGQTALYALPCAQPAPSVPDATVLLRRAAMAMEVVGTEWRESDPTLRLDLASALAAAPEAKP